MTIKEQYEGAESREFWEGLGHNSRVADRSLYLSLAERPKENRYDYTPRLFHLTSWTGQFRADEIPPTLRVPQLPCPYPFVQVGNKRSPIFSFLLFVCLFFGPLGPCSRVRAIFQMTPIFFIFS